MATRKIKEDIYWIGVIDWQIRDFHGYSTLRGSSYNSYLIKDKKIALFDTVKKAFTKKFLHNLRQLVSPEKIDYLIIDHVEMDHTGALPEIIEIIKPQKIFCSKMGARALRAHFYKDWPLEVVSTGDKLSLGQKDIIFIETKMIHWPDSMVSYIPQEKILISQDAFGQHYALPSLFDKEVDYCELIQEAAKYYANIVLPFSPQVEKFFKTLSEMKLEVDMILPDHGVVWKKYVPNILELYKKWARQEAEKKAVILYASMWKSTEKMAMAFAEGVTQEGLPI